ncbi:MAG TPA: hypothetical protein VJ599_03390 [Nitrososphaeraceae archaeon]|nr:hypothetical protein [Nitrososphaeraceae archaeon]
MVKKKIDIIEYQKVSASLIPIPTLASIMSVDMPNCLILVGIASVLIS